MPSRPLSLALLWAVGVATLLVVLICGVVGSVVSVALAFGHDSHEYHSVHVHNALFITAGVTFAAAVVISLVSMIGVLVLRLSAEVRSWPPIWQGVAGVGFALAVGPAAGSVIGALVGG